MDLYGLKALIPSGFEVLANVVEKQHVGGLHARVPAQAPAPLGVRVCARKLVQPAHGEPVDARVGLAQPHVRRRDEDVEQAPHGVGERVPPVERVARREDDRVAQRAENVAPAAPEALQGWEHPRVRGVGLGHHLIEEPLAVEPWHGRRLPRQRGRPGRLARVKRPPLLRAVQVAVEAGEEGGVHGDVAALELVPVPVGRGLGERVVYPAGRDVEADFIV